MPPKIGNLSIKDVADVILINKETGDVVNTSNILVYEPKPITFKDYLVVLDREVASVHHEYFKGIGIPVILSNIEDQPDWMVVRLYPPHKEGSIWDLEHVVSIQRVEVEIENN